MRVENICGTPKAVDPRSLLTPLRLDYAVKYRYFRHLMYGNDLDAERIYCWHIKERTGGNEPRSPKNTLEDYVVGCEELLHSLESDGFDPEYELKIGSNLLLIGGGAHRMSACLALGIPIIATLRDKPGRMTWDEGWFKRHGMGRDDLRNLNRLWRKLGT